MPSYTAPLPRPLDCRTELSLVVGDLRPAGMKTLDMTNRSSRPLYGAICHRWGPRNERICQQPFDLAFLSLGALDDALQERDVFVSQGIFFRPTRRKAHLHAIALLYLDLDYRKATAFRRGRYDAPPSEVAVERVLAHLDSRRLPRPSYAVSSGRGLHLKWLTEALHPAALSRWQACMTALCRELQPYGADPNAKDASRILRPIGSTNSKSGAVVREVWRNADAAGGICVYRFDQLAEAILPLSRQECREQREAKQARQAARRRTKKLASGQTDEAKAAAAQATVGSKQLWKLRLRDIERLFELRRYDRCGGIPDGMRVTAMMIVAVALSHLVQPGDVLPRLHQYRNRWLAHWSDEKLRQSVATVLRVAPEGRRLYYKNSTLVELLRISPAECRKLQTIGLDDEQRKENRRTAAAAKRRAAGAVPRDVARAERGRRASAVLAMRAAGTNWQEICGQLDISRATANRLYAHAMATMPPASRRSLESGVAPRWQPAQAQSLHRAEPPVQPTCSAQLCLPLTPTLTPSPPAGSQTSGHSTACADIISCVASRSRKTGR